MAKAKKQELMVLDPENIDLNFESDNKTDSLISYAWWEIPFDIQEYIKKNFPTERADMFSFFKNAYGDQSLKKHDPRFEKFRPYVAKCIRGTFRHNFSDDEIGLIISMATYTKPLQIAMEIFPDRALDFEQGFLNQVSADIKELISAFGLEYEGERGAWNTPVLTENDWISPVTDDQILRKISNCVPDTPFRKSTLDAHQRKCVRFLKAVLSSTRLLKTINGIRDIKLRQLFEEEFIKVIHDKPDLIPEDVNGYITLCEEYVNLEYIKERQYTLQEDFKNCSEGDNKAEGIILRKDISQQITGASKEVNDCKARIASIAKALSGSRESRLEKENEISKSISRYINIFADEEKRRAAVAAAKAKNDELKKKLHDIEEWDKDTKGEIHGISLDEILGFNYTPLP